MILNNIHWLLNKRRYLRNHMTEEELILWSKLKHSQLNGWKFRRQHSIGFYILDFYCPIKRIGIELDGGQHYQDDNIDYDKNRDAFLEACEIKTLRFSNFEIRNNLTGVLNCIENELSNRVYNDSRRTTPCVPSLRRRGKSRAGLNND